MDGATHSADGPMRFGVWPGKFFFAKPTILQRVGTARDENKPQQPQTRPERAVSTDNKGGHQPYGDDKGRSTAGALANAHLDHPEYKYLGRDEKCVSP